MLRPLGQWPFNKLDKEIKDKIKLGLGEVHVTYALGMALGCQMTFFNCVVLLLEYYSNFSWLVGWLAG
jgi:mannitol-specific phosphotransferase system IIBC component